METRIRSSIFVYEKLLIMPWSGKALREQNLRKNIFSEDSRVVYEEKGGIFQIFLN